MIRGAKVVILDPEENMLVLYRSGTHPHIPHTPDLPGGKVEKNETMLEGLIREVCEETGLVLREDELRLISSHDERNYFGQEYHLELFEVTLASRPDIAISYEHEKYEWQPRSDAEIIGKLYSALLRAYKLSVSKRL